MINNLAAIPHQQSFVEVPKKSCFNRILERITQLIIWLFKKIFPCCFRDAKPTLKSILEPKKSIAPIREPDKIVPLNFEKILNMPKELQEIVVQSFSRDDLDSFDLALSTCKSTASNRLHGLVKQSRTKEILRCLLVDHPDWQKDVEAWKGVSTEDKVWLLRLHELHHLPRITITQIADFFPAQPNQSLHIPSTRTPELLANRNEIEKYLSTIVDIPVFNNFNFIKCPEAICLLKNLKFLRIMACRMLVPPDVRWNTNLVQLCCNSNLLARPPDVRWNPKLEELDLSGNCLKSAPNVTRNPALRRLILYKNQLSEVLDVSKNENLTHLELVNNRLKLTPNLSQNPDLRILTLGKNQLQVLPDLSKNVQLKILYANDNNLTAPPDLKWNRNLVKLCLTENPIQTLPDLSHNVKLETLEANNCALTKLPSLVNHSKLIGLFLNKNKLTTFPELSPNTDLRKLTIMMKDNPLSDDAKRKMLGNSNFQF